MTSLSTLSFRDAVAHRHSVYALSDTLPPALTDTAITDMVKDALLQVPSAFNTQTTRCILLLHSEHKKLWTFATDIMLSKTPEDKKASTKARFDGFTGAYGTVVFLEDHATIEKSKAHTPYMAPLFEEWSEHTSAMHQFVLWAGLESVDGVGANLQHYHSDPEIEKEIMAAWKVPAEWKIRAQLVFGGVKGEFPEAKPKLPTEQTLLVYTGK